jgi:hypothetical protein
MGATTIAANRAAASAEQAAQYAHAAVDKVDEFGIRLKRLERRVDGSLPPPDDGIPIVEVVSDASARATDASLEVEALAARMVLEIAKVRKDVVRELGGDRHGLAKLFGPRARRDVLAICTALAALVAAARAILAPSAPPPAPATMVPSTPALP